jgi:hypothetical protein
VYDSLDKLDKLTVCPTSWHHLELSGVGKTYCLSWL